MMMSEQSQTTGCKRMVYPKSTWSAADSLVSLLALPAAAKGKKMKGFCGRKCFASWEKLNQSGYWAKMLQGSCQLLMFPGDGGELSEPYSTTWPRWGIVSGGRATELVRSVRHTKEIGYLSWPTPRANDAEKRGQIGDDVRNGLPATVKHWPTPHANCGTGSGKHGDGGINLQTAVKQWPTPTTNDSKNSTFPESQKDRKSIIGVVMNIENPNNGQLNADWVECLMGYPIGWTDLDCDDPVDWPGWPAPLSDGTIRTPQACNGKQGPKSQQFYDQCIKTSESSITLTDQVRHSQYSQFCYEPPRVIEGQKNRAKRLKCLGNAVVPQQIYPIFAAIKAIEEG